jgi:NADPH-dependent 2,4-dienoyl-CoA reductase/sulfur reductase-like enzyme/rhodanese-related sulfurtransferase
MRLLVIGAVAAGTSAAAKARRNREDLEIVIYEKDRYISYSGCGMPYYVGGELADFEELVPRDTVYFKKKYNIDIMTEHEVLEVDPENKRIQVKNINTGDVFWDAYDKLVIATGASPLVPSIKGVERDNVFVFRGIGDMNRILGFMQEKQPKKAIIIGAGFIGLEMCENLARRGLQVSLVERLNQVSPGLDEDMAVYVQKYLEEKGIAVYTGAEVTEIDETGVMLGDGKRVEGELVILATGVRPNTDIAKRAGIELGVAGAIRVDERMQTNIPDIYACGDCAETYHIVLGKPAYRPLGSTANKTGRIAGDSLTGGNMTFKGILGTGIYRVFELAVAQTGLTEREARDEGYDVAVSHDFKVDRPEYLGGKEMVIKGVADKDTGRLLGAQIVGYGGVDKRIDVFATAITYGAKAEDLFHLDLAYSPPFSTSRDPVAYTGMILDNAINRDRPLITPQELAGLIKSGESFVLIDTREPELFDLSHVENAENVPQALCRNVLVCEDKECTFITYCSEGKTGSAVQSILKNYGIEKVYNLSGGIKNFVASHPEEVIAKPDGVTGTNPDSV